MLSNLKDNILNFTIFPMPLFHKSPDFLVMQGRSNGVVSNKVSVMSQRVYFRIVSFFFPNNCYENRAVEDTDLKLAVLHE